MRLRVEFTTEPFDLDEVPPHAVAARGIVQGAALDSVDVGPFGNTAEGRAESVLATIDELLRTSLAAGATRVSLQVNVIADADAEADMDGDTDTDADTDADAAAARGGPGEGGR
ncbi:hypothetical protein GCM10010246_53040 [Streptomyces cuspidosporus]|uniref:Thiamine-binding protein domain-containing protein n=1 Tax=Streptomyces cuspidosporus TaxID=66882 RepID=A0ABN3GNW9_9ACTN